MIPAQPKAGLGNFSRVFILGEFSVDGSEDRAWMGFWKNGRVGLDPGNSAPGGSPSEFMVMIQVSSCLFPISTIFISGFLVCIMKHLEHS